MDAAAADGMKGEDLLLFFFPSSLTKIDAIYEIFVLVKKGSKESFFFKWLLLLLLLLRKHP